MAGISPVTLGPLELVGIEVPTFFDRGGRMRVAVHHVIGGDRVIQILGTEPQRRQLQGCFIGPAAAERAQLLESLRDAGQPLELTIGAWTELVLITGVVIRYTERGSVVYYVINSEAIPQSVAFDMTSTNAVVSEILGDLGQASSAVGNVAGSDVYFPLLASTLSGAINSLSSSNPTSSSAQVDLLDPSRIVAGALNVAGSALAATSDYPVEGSLVSGSAVLVQATQDALIVATASQAGGYLNRADFQLATLNGTTSRPLIHS